MNMLRQEERKKELVHELERLTKMLRKDKEIRLVMLFGSLARGDISRKSDIDMVFIKNTKERVSRSVGRDLFGTGSECCSGYFRIYARGVQIDEK